MPKLDAGQTALSGLSGFAKGMMEGMKFNREMEVRDASLAATAKQRETTNKLAEEKFNYEKGQDTLKNELDIKKYNLDLLKAIREEGNKGDKRNADIEAQIRMAEIGSMQGNKTVLEQQKRLSEIRNIGLGSLAKEEDGAKVIGHLDALKDAIDKGDEAKVETLTNNLDVLKFGRGNTVDFIDTYKGLKSAVAGRDELKGVAERFKQMRTPYGKKTQSDVVDVLKQNSNMPHDQAENLGTTINTAVLTKNKEIAKSAAASVDAAFNSGQITAEQRDQIFVHIADGYKEGSEVNMLPSTPLNQTLTNVPSAQDKMFVPKEKALESTFKKMLDKGDEAKFKKWYSGYAEKFKLDPNPDSPEHHYDYRAAWKAGATPGADGHWPSEFKEKDHPNRFVKIKGVLIDTITGKPASK